MSPEQSDDGGLRPIVENADCGLLQAHQILAQHDNVAGQAQYHQHQGKQSRQPQPHPTAMSSMSVATPTTSQAQVAAPPSMEIALAHAS